MSQKAQLPSLSGQRIKTRKRDEKQKEKYDPVGFRDAIFEGLENAGEDLESVSRFLDSAGQKLDYRRYGEQLVEILVAGGLLAPGGIILQDGELNQINTCIFGLGNNMEAIRAFEQIFTKLVRRYKYLEKMQEAEMKKILVYLKGFTEEQRVRLAQITALWLASGQIPAKLLSELIQDHQVKDGTALDFLMELLSTLKQEKGGQAVTTLIKKSGVENRLMDFFPPTNRQKTEENFAKSFEARGLQEVVNFRKNVEKTNVRNELVRLVSDSIVEEKSEKQIVAEVKEFIGKNSVLEQEVAVVIWQCVMDAEEWSKKEDILQEQVVRHLKKYLVVLGAFTTALKTELNVLNKIQEYCYDHMIFLKSFNKIILLLYKTDILSEDSILKWYKETHSSRGWTVFMDQMKKFVDWLEQAEEEETDDDEED